MSIVAITVLGIVFVLQLLAKKSHSDFYQSGIFGVIVLCIGVVSVMSYAGYQSWQQYQTWSTSDVGKFFLPPYESWDYYILYIRTRFFNAYALSLLIATIFLIVAKQYNKKYQERFFNQVEPYLLALGILMVGHPGWIFYGIALALVAWSASLFHFWRSGKEYRLPLLYVWLPTAIFIILIGEFLTTLQWWSMLKF
ncbi:MAG: hypothetical protein Q8R26_01060 [bacterium]|nr:hypothetical protein [bacterium]